MCPRRVIKKNVDQRNFFLTNLLLQLRYRIKNRKWFFMFLIRNSKWLLSGSIMLLVFVYQCYLESPTETLKTTNTAIPKPMISDSVKTADTVIVLDTISLPFKKDAMAYAEKYKDIAKKEARIHGIPASIKLAQGILESDKGTSPLAVNNYNHFGTKCFSKYCGKDHCSNYIDDHHKDFFRIFKSPEESYKAHSIFLKKDRYRPCFKCADYKCWATQLKKCGYATDPRYANKLITIIEKYNLTQYDR